MSPTRPTDTSEQPGAPRRADGPAHEAILASTLDPVITINAHGTIETISRSIERVFGWSPEELIGRNISVLMPEPYRSQHDGYLLRYAQTGRTNILGATRELVGQHRDGHVFPIELSVSRVELPHGGPPLFTGIIHDISDRREAEEALAAQRERLEELITQRTAELESTHEQLRLADRLAAIGTLAAGLGHDMNNVLLPIRMHMDAIEALPLPERARDHLIAIRRSAEYLQQLSDGLHLLALDPADAHASSDATDINEWWRQAGPLLSRTLPRHVTLTVSLTPDAPPIRVPSHRLTQAVLNLMVNAGEAVDEEAVRRAPGSVTLWSRVFPDRRFVELGVADNGHGMSAQVRRRALEPFFTTKTRGLGTGLGLSLAHGVAAGAGGTLDIDSAEGEGTTVRLTFAVHEERKDGRDHTLPAVVGVQIDDPRLRGVISMLITASGLSAGAPEHADALITDNLSVAAAHAHRAHLRCILLGPAPANAVVPEHTAVLADPQDFEELRRVVHALAATLPPRPAPEPIADD